MSDKIFSWDWDRWSLVILVLFALGVGFFLVKTIAELSLLSGVVLIICLVAIIFIPGLLPHGVRVGFAAIGFVMGLLLALF